MVTFTTCCPLLAIGKLLEEDVLTLGSPSALYRAWHSAGEVGVPV